jgi:hypothetical protein
MSFLGVGADTANANKPAFNTMIAGIAGVDETSVFALSFADFFQLGEIGGDGVDRCFLDGGDCASCCPDCNATTSLDSSAADHCVCYEAVAEYEYTGITLSDYDDCLHIMRSPFDYPVSGIYGGSGNDVIVLEGDNNRFIAGGDGDDVITLTGHSAYMVSGGYGDDKITITGNGAYQIFGGVGDDNITITGDDPTYVFGKEGDDTIIITGDNPTYVSGEQGDDTIIITGDASHLSGGADHDSCSILGEGDTDCEREVAGLEQALAGLFDIGVKALYDIKVEDDDEANEISGRITSADPAAVSVEGLEYATCLSIDAPANYATFA